MSEHLVKTGRGTVITNPPIARFLFDDTRMAIVWLILRVYVGYQWLSAGWTKLNEASWMGDGSALKGYFTNAVSAPNGKPVISIDWYRNFIQFLLDSGSYVWFAKLVAIGEFTVGVLLIIGMFVGIAAFAAGFMNWNYLMAGTASVNGLLFFIAVVLILAWKTAGWLGVDRYLLPRLGTPWRPGITAPLAATPVAPPEKKVSSAYGA